MKELTAHVMSGDWYGDWEKNPVRYFVGYRVFAHMPPNRLSFAGAMPVVYASPEVAQDVAQRQESMRQENPDMPRVEWDGRTLRTTDPDPGIGEKVAELGERYDGLVRLPEWGWGPVDASECDSVIG